MGKLNPHISNHEMKAKAKKLLTGTRTVTVHQTNVSYCNPAAFLSW